MLLGNHSVLLKTPGRALSGVSYSTYRSAWGKRGATQNQFMSFDKIAAIPSGYRPPYGWGLPLKSGQLSSFTIIGGSGTATGSPAGGRNGEASLSGTGDMTGTGALIVSAIALLTGSGVINNAAALAYLNAAATIAGTGNITGAAQALGFAFAALSGSGSISSVPRAEGELDAALTLTTSEALSVDDIASAVWDTAQGQFLYAIAHNRVVTDPVSGTFTVYASDDTTVLYSADLWQDAAGTTPYVGSGADRRDRLT